MIKHLSASIAAILLLSLAGCGRREADSFSKSQTNPSDTVINTADSLEDISSTAYRSNILNAAFSYIGVGCYEANGRLYWTQIFAG